MLPTQDSLRFVLGYRRSVPAGPKRHLHRDAWSQAAGGWPRGGASCLDSI